MDNFEPIFEPFLINQISYDELMEVAEIGSVRVTIIIKKCEEFGTFDNHRLTTAFGSHLNGIFKRLLQEHRIDFADPPGAAYGQGSRVPNSK